MAHIQVPQGTFGILSLFAARPETAGALKQLADTVLRGKHSTLTVGERETLFAFASARNQCEFCLRSHASFAGRHVKGGTPAIRDIIKYGDPDMIIAAFGTNGSKMTSLLRLTQAVVRGGKEVMPEHILAAKRQDALDAEIHDTILIASMACMFNRYVDGLGTSLPTSPSAYEEIASVINEYGYVREPGTPPPVPPDAKHWP
jgi:AhpD family alkylhydroperoxidase